MTDHEIKKREQQLEDIARDIMQKQQRIRSMKLDLEGEIYQVMNMIDKASLVIWSLTREMNDES